MRESNIYLSLGRCTHGHQVVRTGSLFKNVLCNDTVFELHLQRTQGQHCCRSGARSHMPPHPAAYFPGTAISMGLKQVSPRLLH